jgi:hypothetical protein
MCIKLGYIAGKYTGKTSWEVKKNIEKAQELGFQVHLLGLFPVIPHSNSAFMEDYQPVDWWYLGTQELEKKCDCIIMLNGWQESKGSIAEHELAIKLHMPIFYENKLDELKEWLETFR